MPYSVQPGTYSSAYGQQLQKTILTMASNPSMTAAMLTPTPVMQQADFAIGNTIGDIDTQMAAVGISLSPFGGISSNYPTSGLTSPLGGLGAMGGGLTSPLGGFGGGLGGLGGGLTSPLGGLGGGLTSPFGGLGGGMASPLGGLGMSSPLGGMSSGMGGLSGGDPFSMIMAMLYQIMNMLMSLGSQQGTSGGLGMGSSGGMGMGMSSPLMPTNQFSGLG